MRSAIGRSLDVYYRDHERTARMDALNATFVSSGDLVFDIGAHVGDRTASFRRLGARVVTLEPQPKVFRALRLIHGRDPQVTLLREAAGAEVGEIDIHLNTRNPTVSTASKALIDAAPNATGWADQTWDDTIRVPMTTLDHLITVNGTPSFVKIDVEGYEADVLSGLNTVVPCLSFEITTIQRDVAAASLSRLSVLGAYEFNLSLGEDHALHHDIWTTASAMVDTIQALPMSANSGDVYARLKVW
ncbi:FkbM family methyltransferase [Jannaschia sp. CCS1]|uniref:FkbM family methyltransferase n=1 Tax=Jannaschia sp. (strain CCS1) TaxID=290400 RepID=UPI000053ABD8|nr:FkbM family methyltransferase [Jannaschia sp. CCS1]ABD53227.1 Methyltransferase FkbM [Jannaschia sp. CCS1]